MQESDNCPKQLINYQEDKNKHRDKNRDKKVIHYKEDKDKHEDKHKDKGKHISLILTTTKRISANIKTRTRKKKFDTYPLQGGQGQT